MLLQGSERLARKAKRHVSDLNLLSQAGNAMTVPVVEHVAQQVLNIIRPDTPSIRSTETDNQFAVTQPDSTWLTEMNEGERLGSETAKNGFHVKPTWCLDSATGGLTKQLSEWLQIMGYRVDEIEWVRAAKIPGSHKADVQVQVTIKLTAVVGVENLQVKLVSQSAGFNQIDKRWVKSYAELWNIPGDHHTLLRRFTGELPPIGTTNPRRTFADEFTSVEQGALLTFLTDHQTLIVSGATF
ncbi:MAG: hypothetical protein R3C12_21580 [Planctomycetaceae bacterium]